MKKRNQLLLLGAGGVLVVAVALWLYGRRASQGAAPATPQLAPPLVSVVPYASPAPPRAASSVSAQQIGTTWAYQNAVPQAQQPGWLQTPSQYSGQANVGWGQ